jgi:hypothetical protein
MISSVRLAPATVLLLSALHAPAQSPAAATAPGRLFDQPGYRMRGGYLSVNDIQLVAPASEAGLNTLLVGGLKLKPVPDAAARDSLMQWANLCRSHSLALWLSLDYFGAYESVWAGPYRQYVDGEGEQAKHTPCPLDEDYWQRAITQRYRWLAELSGQVPITGLILDPEMYAADKGGFFHVCYCGDCVARTLRAAGRDATPPYPTARRRWLESLGLIETHSQQAREAMRALTERTRAQVEQVAPHLLFGVFGGDEWQPLMEGALLGLGRSDKPVLAFSEATYIAGYSPNVDAIQQRLARLGAHARLTCGVWQSKFPARLLAAHYYECAAHSAGYWVYTLETFSRPDYTPLPSKAADYWAAIRQADVELDRLLRDPHYQTSLKIKPFINSPTPVSSRNVGRYRVVPLVPIVEQVVPPARFRSTNIFYLYATAGDRVSFPLKLLVGTARDAGQYLLVSPDGRELTRADLLQPDTSVEVAFRAEQTGLYALVVGAGNSSVQIEPRRPYAVAAGRTSPAQLYIGIPALYVLAEPGQRQVTFQMGPHGEAERVRVVVTQADQVRYDGVLADTRIVTVPIDPEPAPRILKLDIQRVPGAVRENFSLAVTSGAYPFVAASADGLLHD